MQIFSLFPQILFLAPVVYALYRATIAAFLALDALDQYKKSDVVAKIIAALEVIAAIGLVLGAYAQAAALLSAAIMILQLSVKKYRVLPTTTILLLLIMSIGQVILGPGLFAFDIPL